MKPLKNKIVDILIKKKLTISIAESCTGGFPGPPTQDRATAISQREGGGGGGPTFLTTFSDYLLGLPFPLFVV